jgi:uncharacterized membrane protein
MNWLSLTLRWFHLVAAMIVVGGTIFLRFALIGAVVELADEQRKALVERIRSNWAKLVHAAIAFLLISGIWNFVRFVNEYKTPEWEAWRLAYSALYQFVFGAKFVLALIVFFIASALAGRSNFTRKFRDDAKWWLSVNLVLMLIIVGLSGVLRIIHVGPTLPKGAAVTEPDTPSLTAPTTTAPTTIVPGTTSPSTPPSGG